MNNLIIALKVIVGISILNVWLIQNKKPTIWRGAKAKTIIEEFEAYGLSIKTCYVIGFIKVLLSVLLISSIWFEELAFFSALGLAILLTGSVIMHIKINDIWFKSFPATLFLLMCLAIAFI